MIDEEEQLYASPEEVQGRPGTSASDVFSLGILFFDLFFAVGVWVGKALTAGIRVFKESRA
jgi:serine/threonine protein kinase